MILPDSRFGFGARTPRRRGPSRLILLLLAFVALATFLVIWQRQRIFGGNERNLESVETIEQLWSNRRYEEINGLCEAILREEPMNLKALIYNGFAYFYRGTGQYSFEDKILFLDESIRNLRKAQLHDPKPQAGMIHYVLGKAYHFKGKYYADLTINNLLDAERLGYIGDDSYEYLGLAYSGLAEYEKSAESFLRAVGQSPTDMRYLALAQAYLNNGKADEAEEFLIRTLNKTQDVTVEQKARFLLGKIFLDSDQLPKAEDQFLKILEKEENSADAHYYLGEILLRYNKPIEARAEWRNALKIDPSHYGARLRVYN